MIFQGSEIEHRMQNRTKIKSKMTSEMECSNLFLFCFENRVRDAPTTPQDVPKTSQDAPKTRSRPPKTPPRRPKTRPGRLQDAPKMAQDAPKTPPRRPEPRPRRPDWLQEPPRPPPDLDVGQFWRRFCTMFEFF